MDILSVFKTTGSTAPKPNYQVNILKRNGKEFPPSLQNLEPHLLDKTKVRSFIQVHLIRKGKEGLFKIKIAGLQQELDEALQAELTRDVTEFLEQYFLSADVLEHVISSDASQLYHYLATSFKQASNASDADEEARFILYRRDDPVYTWMKVEKLGDSKREGRHSYTIRMPLSFFTPEQLDLLKHCTSQSELSAELPGCISARVFWGTKASPGDYSLSPNVKTSKLNKPALKRVLFEALDEFLDGDLTRPPEDAPAMASTVKGYWIQDIKFRTLQPVDAESG